MSLLDQIHCEILNGDKWYKCKDICSVLKYSQLRSNLRNLPTNVMKKLPMQTNGGLQCMTFLNEEGFRQLIISSRKPNAVGINVNNHKYECKESETISAVMKAFKSEKMREQYSVYEYCPIIIYA